MGGPRMVYEDYADEEWVDDEDDLVDELLVCPACEQPVHEDTQQCPHCGDWIVPAYPKSQFKQVVWGVAVVLVILSMLAYIL